MSQTGKRVAVRVLVILATCAATFGFRFTGNYLFLALPPAAVAVLFVLVHGWNKLPADEDAHTRRHRSRRSIHLQLAIVLLALSGFFVYSILQHNRESAVGYFILLVELGLLILLTVAEYVRAIRRGDIPGRGEADSGLAPIDE